MVDILKYCVGLDVASDDLVAGFGYLSKTLLSKKSKARSFKNTLSGYKDLDKWINHKKQCPASVSVVMEATGVYHENIAHYLYGKGYNIYVVLPNKAKSYLKSLGLRSKNDPIDSSGLTQMGLDQQHLDQWHPPKPMMRQLRTLTRQRQSVQSQITAVNNQLHALKRAFHVSTQVVKHLKETISFHKKQIKQLEQDINNTLDQEPELKAKINRIVDSIKGVGLLTVVTLLAETNGFQMFSSVQQLIKYAGYDVLEKQSGKRKGIERISKKGNSRIRRILHLPALNMVSYNIGSFSNTYERIFLKSGIKMKGYVAVQRKLLCLIYSLWKKDQVFDPNFKSELCNTPD